MTNPNLPGGIGGLFGTIAGAVTSGLGRIVTIPGIPGTWEAREWDVTRLAAGDVVQWFIPEYAEVLQVQRDADKMLAQLDDHKGLPTSVKVVELPLTVAGQQAAGLVIYKLTQPLKWRTWWKEVATGAVYFVRADGLLQCETGGTNRDVGSILQRAELGTLIPVTV